MLCLCASAATPARAIGLHRSGFETNDFTLTEWTSIASGSPTIQTTTKHSGSYAMRANTSSAQAVVSRAFSSGTTNQTYFLVSAFYIASACNDTTDIMKTMNSSVVSAARIRVTSGNNIVLLNNVTSTSQTSSTTLSTATWYILMLKHVSLDSGGSMEARIYNDMGDSPVETLSITGEDTQNTDVRSFQFGVGTAATCDLYFDDVAINDATGTFQNDYPQTFKLAMVKPASDQTVTWTKTGANCSGTTNTDCVDDEPGTPDDASGYNTSSTANNEDRLNSTTLPAEVPSDADMILLAVMDRWDGNGTSGTRQGRHLIWDEASAQTNGPTHSRCDVTAGTWSIATMAQITVFDLGARTKANVESFDLGYEPLNSNECRVTAIWANVEWRPAPVAPPGGKHRRYVYQ